MAAEVPTSEVLNSLQGAIKDVLVKALRTRAISLSSHEEKRTGNAYQAIRLGDEMLRGFRADDRNVFAGIDLKDKSIIDLGCNLGEICRDAARAGATHVEGLEYDHYFVQMARYVAAFNALDAVMYRQGDLTNPDSYKGTYDVVSALSVFTYIKNHIDLIARMTKKIFVCETHSVRSNWKSLYLESLKKNFKHVALVAISDHKAADKAECRYLMFASQNRLDTYLHERARALAQFPAKTTIDMSQSKIATHDEFVKACNIQRGTSFDEIANNAAKSRPQLAIEHVANEVAEKFIIRSHSYWSAFLKGYSEFRVAGGLTSENFYFCTLKHLVDKNLYDASFKSLMENSDLAKARISKRFEMIVEAERNDFGKTFDPIVLYNIVAPAHANKPSTYEFHLNPADELVYPLAIDGHHRAFVTYMLGVKSLPALPMWYEEIPGAQSSIKRHPALRDQLWDYVFDLSQKIYR